MASNAYDSRVLIGNWSEDVELEKLRLREFLDKKAAGTLRLTATNAASQAASLSVSTDGTVPYGAAVAVYSESEKGLVSLDPTGAARSGCGDGASAAAAAGCAGVAPGAAPQTRSVFIVCRGEDGQRSGSRAGLGGSLSPSVVCYGDSVVFAGLARGECGSTVVLASELVGLGSGGSVPSRYQEVYGVAVDEGSSVPYAAEWTVHHFDPLVRDEAVGQPVPANGRVLLVHRATHAALASTGKPSHAGDLEACAHTFRNTHKAELPQNHFALLMHVAAPSDAAPSDAQQQV